MRTKKEKTRRKEENRGALLIFIGLVMLLVGYLIGCIFPFSSTPGVPVAVTVTEAAENLSKGINSTNAAINLTVQKQYDEARAMLNKSENSSRRAGEYLEPYNVEKEYLDNLIACINNLLRVINLSKTNNTAETIEYINKSLADFSDLENTCAELKKYPGIAERLNIEETMVNLTPVKYDMLDFRAEYNKENATALLPPISFDFEGGHKEFKWKDHLGKEGMFKIRISERRYERYNKSLHNVDVDEDYLNFITPNDRVIKEMAEWFNNNAYPNDKEDKANCILSFVQKCVPYVSETQAKEYCRYPIETMIEGGDCGDKSLLFLSILKAVGYDDIALIHFEDHAMGGIALEEELKRTENEAYLKKSGKTYYVCETTEEGWCIGRIREEYMAKSPRCLIVNTSKS